MKRFLSLCALALALACGARSQLGVGLGAGDASAGLCLGVLPSTTTSAPLGAACSPGPGVALAAIIGTSLVFVGRDHTVTLAHSFFQDVPGLAPSVAYVSSRGKYVGAMLSGFPLAQPNTNKSHIEIVILDVTTGEKLAQDEVDAGENGDVAVPPGLFGNDEGTFAYGYLAAQKSSALGVLSSTGGSLHAPEIMPMGDPSADQIIPVYEQNDSGGAGDVYWFDPCTGIATPSHEHTVQAAEGARPLSSQAGSRIVYLDYATWTLFDEGPHDVSKLPLADLGSSFRFADMNASGWVLLATDDPYTFVTANVALGQKHKIPLQPFAPGFWLLNPLDAGVDPTGVRAASDGSLIVPLRNNDHASLFSNGGSGWKELGLPIGQVYSATPFEHEGTYLMYGTWEPVAMSWPPPQNGRVDGTGTQLVRPDASQAFVVENLGPSFGLTQNYSLSHDGGCLAFYDDKLHMRGALTASLADIDLSSYATPNHVFASSWIEGADADFFGSP